MIDNIVSFIVNTIFTGTLILTACILLARGFKINLQRINLNILTLVLNGLLLFEGVLFLIGIFTAVFKAYYSAGEYEQYTYSGHVSTGVAATLVIFIFLTHGLIPQLLWVSKFRRSITVPIILVCVWVLYHLVRAIFVDSHLSWSRKSLVTLSDIFAWAVAYLAILPVVYWLASKKSQS
jgi:hypothetical protein